MRLIGIYCDSSAPSIISVYRKAPAYFAFVGKDKSHKSTATVEVKYENEHREYRGPQPLTRLRAAANTSLISELAKSARLGTPAYFLPYRYAAVIFSGRSQRWAEMFAQQMFVSFRLVTMLASPYSVVARQKSCKHDSASAPKKFDCQNLGASLIIFLLSNDRKYAQN